MFKKPCDNPKCNKGPDTGRKEVFVYAKSMTGALPVAYCSSFCEKEAKYESRFSK